MICTTIQNRDLEGILEIIDSGDVEMAEIRLDRCDLSQEDIEELFSTSDVPLVATCRVSEIRAGLTGTDDRKLDTQAIQIAESRLITAIHSGAAYADIEIEAPAMMSKRIRRETKEYGTVLVRSYHDFNGTDSLEALKALTEKCYSLGADIAKIVTTAKDGADSSADNEDCRRVLSLYSCFEPARLIAFAMGPAGRESRVECLEKGAPYTYAALTEAEAAAPGQMSTAKMRERIYGDRQPFGGETLQMPASKSFAQRAIIAAALADGVSSLSGYSACGDNEAAISVARALGAEVTVGIAYRDGVPVKNSSVLTVKGIGAKRNSLAISALHTGESGLLTRMMIPLMSILGLGSTEITGEGTLTRRPLRGAKEIMASFGVKLSDAGNGAEDDRDVKVPLTVEGMLRPGEREISGAGGSQIISGLLMALPLAESDSVVVIRNPKSIPYLFITMDVLKAFGVKVSCEMEGGEAFAESRDWDDCTGITLHIKGGQKYKSADMEIEGDWSSASNFLVAGAVFGQADISGLDTRSLQADLSIMDILMEAGASLSQSGDDDPKGVIHTQRAPLNAFEINAANCPDLFPIVSVLAAFCQGTSRISGTERLTNKESDRAGAILEMLSGMGVNARITSGTLIIEGHSLVQRLLTGKLLRGGSYSSHNDHRMAMALKVAELGADGPVKIDNTECVSKSFPSFFGMFGTMLPQNRNTGR
jgi:3-phosphoshikimate 1-carboxyvinyltransferase